MSGTTTQSNTWTPDIISNVASRVVMVIVSVAFIWRKFRSPVRAIDEENPIGSQPPTSHRHYPASTNKITNTNRPQFRSRSAVSSLVAAQLSTLVELASGLDNDQIDNNSPTFFMDGPSTTGRNSTESAHTGVGMEKMYLNCQMEVDLNLGYLGLRIMPGESKHGHWGKDV